MESKQMPSIDALWEKIDLTRNNDKKINGIATAVAEMLLLNWELFERALEGSRSDGSVCRLSDNGRHSLWGRSFSSDRLTIHPGSSPNYFVEVLVFVRPDKVTQLAYCPDRSNIENFVEHVPPYLKKRLELLNEDIEQYFAKLREIFSTI